MIPYRTFGNWFCFLLRISRLPLDYRKIIFMVSECCQRKSGKNGIPQESGAFTKRIFLKFNYCCTDLNFPFGT